MKSFVNTLLKKRRAASPPTGSAQPLCAARGTTRGDSAALRDEIVAQGLDADRALALGEALEAEGRLLDALDAFRTANRLRRDPNIERRLVRLRVAAFAQIDRSLPSPEWPPFVPDAVLRADGEPPMITPAQLTPATLREGILRQGCLWVRGLLRPSRVARLCDAIDRSIEAQEAVAASAATAETQAWCDPIDGLPNGTERRFTVRAAQGVLTVDSPRALYEFLETIDELHIDSLLAAYFGEQAALAAEKCTLRRLDPSDWRLRLANWHQDGSFLGHGIRSVNAWFTLSRCGRTAPGLDLIPKRLPRLLPTGEDGAYYDWTVSPETIARELPGVPICRPEFEAGDVLFFDDLFLHRTAADAGMSDLRYGIESWFFAASVYPQGSIPLVV